MSFIFSLLKDGDIRLVPNESRDNPSFDLIDAHGNTYYFTVDHIAEFLCKLNKLKAQFENALKDCDYIFPY